MTASLTTRAEQREVVAAFARDLDRERHNLAAADLGRFPQLVFQQLYNRLQWTLPEAAARRAASAAARRGGAKRPPWLHLRSRFHESEALIRTLSGHSNMVRACAVSPDGAFIVSASTDHTLKLWDVATGAELRTLTGHGSIVSACAVSPDGAWIVSGDSDGTLKLWDAATGAELRTLSGHSDYVRACAVSPDGAFVVSASDDKTLKLWDAASGEELLSYPALGRLTACAASPLGDYVCCGDGGGTVYILGLSGALTGAPRPRGAAAGVGGGRRPAAAVRARRSAAGPHETSRAPKPPPQPVTQTPALRRRSELLRLVRALRRRSELLQEADAEGSVASGDQSGRPKTESSKSGGARAKAAAAPSTPCPHCGSANLGGAVRCLSCGRDLPSAADAPTPVPEKTPRAPKPPPQPVRHTPARSVESARGDLRRSRFMDALRQAQAARTDGAEPGTERSKEVPIEAEAQPHESRSPEEHPKRGFLGRLFHGDD